MLTDFHIFPVVFSCKFVQNHARHQSSAASVHRRHELGRPRAVFLPICVVNYASDMWRKRLCVGIRVKVLNVDRECELKIYVSECIRHLHYHCSHLLLLA